MDSSSGVAPIIGIVIGVSTLALPAFLVGWLDAAPIYLLLWAMLWAPLFSWLPEPPTPHMGHWTARLLTSFLVSTFFIAIVMGLFFGMGRVAVTLF